MRSSDGIRYRFDTTNLVAGNAYTMWVVVVNDPASCDMTPCAAPQIIGDPAVDGQVAWGLDGKVGRDNGTAHFRARIEAGPLLDGWIRVQGLDDPMGAEIHLIVNDHGPIIHSMRREMLSTYRAGCADTSPFPGFFPRPRSPTAHQDPTRASSAKSPSSNHQAPETPNSPRPRVPSWGSDETPTRPNTVQ